MILASGPRRTLARMSVLVLHVQVIWRLAVTAGGCHCVRSMPPLEAIEAGDSSCIFCMYCLFLCHVLMSFSMHPTFYSEFLYEEKGNELNEVSRSCWGRMCLRLYSGLFGVEMVIRFVLLRKKRRRKKRSLTRKKRRIPKMTKRKVTQA